MSQPRRPHRSTPGRGPGESTWPVSSSSRKAFTRNDLTGQAAAMMQTLLTLPPSPIGLQAFVPTSGRKPQTSPPRWQTAGCAPSGASPERSEASGGAAAARRGQVEPGHRSQHGRVAPSCDRSAHRDIPPAGHLWVTPHGGRPSYRSQMSRAARAGLTAIGPRDGWPTGEMRTVQQIRIHRPRARREHSWQEALPPDPRDPDLVRAKALARAGGRAGSRTARQSHSPRPAAAAA